MRWIGASWRRSARARQRLGRATRAAARGLSTRRKMSAVGRSCGQSAGDRPQGAHRRNRPLPRPGLVARRPRSPVPDLAAHPTHRVAVSGVRLAAQRSRRPAHLCHRSGAQAPAGDARSRNYPLGRCARRVVGHAGGAVRGWLTRRGSNDNSPGFSSAPRSRTPSRFPPRHHTSRK